MKLTFRLKGGRGSGHHGHAGRPGDVGQVAIGNDVGRIQLVSADNARGFYAKFWLQEIHVRRNKHGQ